MDDLVRFLTACLDDDAARATAAAEDAGGRWYYDGGYVLSQPEDHLVATGSMDFLEAERGEHIARHDPARVLREIDAKRKILALWKTADDEAASDQRYAESYGTSPDGFPAGREDALESVLRLLALPYADRPGFREEWRP